MLNGLASVGKSGESMLNCLVNVSKSGKSQHFPVFGHFLLAKFPKFPKFAKFATFTKLAKMMPKRLQHDKKFCQTGQNRLTQSRRVQAKVLGESGKSKQNSSANVGESGESQRILVKMILASTRTRYICTQVAIA